MESGIGGKGPLTDQDAENITRVEELAYELKIEEVMTRNLLKLTPEIKMGDALDLFRQDRISGAPVVVGDNLVGVLSIEDLIRCLRLDDMSAQVQKYMSGQPITIHSYDPVVEALKFLSTRISAACRSWMKPENWPASLPKETSPAACLKRSNTITRKRKFAATAPAISSRISSPTAPASFYATKFARAISPAAARHPAISSAPCSASEPPPRSPAAAGSPFTKRK